MGSQCVDELYIGNARRSLYPYIRTHTTKNRLPEDQVKQMSRFAISHRTLSLLLVRYFVTASYEYEARDHMYALEIPSN